MFHAAPLARTRLVPDQLPDHPGTVAVRRVPRPGLHPGVPDRVRATLEPAGDRRRPVRPADRHLAARPRRPPPRLRRRDKLQTDPAWKDNLLSFEYFHGDNGAGLGAMHQTGWTALVADLIIDPPRSSRRLIFADTADPDQAGLPTPADPATASTPSPA